MSDPFWGNYQPTGDYPEHQLKFDRVGVGIAGVVTNRRFVFDPPVPELWIMDANNVEWQVACGPADLADKLYANQVAVGDMVAILFAETKPSKNGNARKIFNVQVRKAAPQAPVAPAPAPMPSPAPAPAPAPLAPVQAAPEPFPANPAYAPAAAPAPAPQSDALPPWPTLPAQAPATPASPPASPNAGAPAVDPNADLFAQLSQTFGAQQ